MKYRFKLESLFTYIKRPNILILLILIPFIIFTLPLCFQNISYLNLLSAFHVDSGSILGSIFTVLNKKQFYNQNLGYHTAYYGFLYNSILIWLFTFYHFILNLNIISNFYVFALSARFFSLLISLATISFFYFFSLKILKNTILSLILTGTVTVFYDFIFYSTLIKPDILTLLLSIGSFYLLFKYLHNYKINYFILSSLLGALAVFNKQQYIFITVPLFVGYFITPKIKVFNFLSCVKKMFNVFFRALFVILITYFVIHPFAFIQFDKFIKRQSELKHMVSAPINENINFWFNVYLGQPLIVVGIFLLVFYLIFFFLIKRKTVENKIIFLISIFCCLYLIWLTILVGPIRVTAYLLPIYSFLLLISVYTIKQIFIFIEINKNKYFFLFFKFIIMSIYSLFLLNNSIVMYSQLNKFKENSNNFSNSPQVISIYRLIKKPPIIQPLNTMKIVYTISIPIPENFFMESKNDWQFGEDKFYLKNIKDYQPDLLMIDTNQWYEKPLSWWQNTAQNIGLNKKIVYYENNYLNKIVLFYR